GLNIFNGNKIKGNTYGNYIQSLIKKYDLSHNIEFCGMLDAENMKRVLLESNVFVSASSLENSSNSLGEAMLLGVPCIASDVGGCADMIQHKKEGFLYPFDESYKLAFYLCKVFDDYMLASSLGLEARKKARITHDKEKNNEILYEIYKKVISKSSI
ncbi:MAG: glycosyltransferase, partial [Clostridium saudiense]|nr:glycosyltransferase [Clostridium saudiense]